MSDRIWHSTATAAAELGAHPSTVLKALEAGELHGAQRVKKGRWRIHRDCLTAFGLGVACEHADAATPRSEGHPQTDRSASRRTRGAQS